MYEIIFLITLGMCYLLFAVIQDLKSREIADWLNFSLIIFVLAFRFFYSLFNQANFNFFFQGLFGFGTFFILGNLFYYSRMFAGGDAKLMIALGTLFPMSYSFSYNLKLFVIFFICFFIASFFYVLLSSLFLVIKNFKSFKKKTLIRIKNQKGLIIGSWLFFIFLALINLLFLRDNTLLYLGFFILIILYSYIYSKSLEECCMIKDIPTKKLTEGDWLYKDVKLKNSIIKSKWEGLTKEEISKLRHELKSVKIKQGIPFSPSFLIAFILFIVAYFYKII